MTELKNPFDFKDKTILIIPRMKDINLENNKNILSTPIYKLSKLAESFGAKEVAMPLMEFDIVLSMFSGDEIDKSATPANYALKSGKLYLELHWDVINVGFFVERLGIDGKYENVNTPTKDNPNVLDSKAEVLGYSIPEGPIRIGECKTCKEANEAEKVPKEEGAK